MQNFEIFVVFLPILYFEIRPYVIIFQSVALSRFVTYFLYIGSRSLCIWNIETKLIASFIKYFTQVSYLYSYFILTLKLNIVSRMFGKCVPGGNESSFLRIFNNFNRNLSKFENTSIKNLNNFCLSDSTKIVLMHVCHLKPTKLCSHLKVPKPESNCLLDKGPCIYTSFFAFSRNLNWHLSSAASAEVQG